MSSPTGRRIQATIVLLTLLGQLLLFVPAAQAQQPTVTIGQPNVWSLEQAHYLLARIRERNLGITNPALAPADLDPNAINGTRLDALRTFFELGVSFDQGLGLNNRMGRQNLEFNQARRQELLTRRSALFDERNRMLDDKGRLLSELTALQATSGNDDAIKQKNSEIDALNKKLEANNSQLENLKTESDLLGSASSTITSPTPPTGPGAFSNGIGDRIGKTITDSFAHDADKNPRLAASIKLDNYVQMQYELLAKQLTLLRDEVGPDQRLIFLELPTSIYVPPKSQKDLIAQSLWRVDSFYRNNDYLADMNAVDLLNGTLYDKFVSDSEDKTLAAKYRLLVDYDAAERGLNQERADIRRRFYEDEAETLKRGEQFFAALNDDTKLTDEANGEEGLKGRIVDLIPRQSSLNVSDINEHINEHSIKAIFSFLIGVGVSGTYQRRHEQFEQFQQQEVYAAGFGKGSNVFGWTFSPMPGTQRLAPGIRTTYAVMIVPRRATHMILQATTRRLTPQSDSTNYDAPETFIEDGNTKVSSFDITIPGAANEEGFFVTRIDYPQIPVNQRSVVVIRGNFSTQTGVLVNGTPLTRVVGVAGPWLGSERESNTNAAMDLGEPDKNIKGYYEIINSNQIILVFLMNKDFKGTPDITLVSPERARSLNNLTLNVNGQPGQHLPSYVIGKKDEEAKTPLAISDVQLTVTRPNTKPPYTSVTGKVNLSLTGVKKGEDPKIYFGAIEVTKISKLAVGLYNVAVDLPVNDEKISFTVTQGDDSSTKQLDNPIFAKVGVVRINYSRGDEEDPDDDEVTIELAGTRIADLDAQVIGATREWRGQTASQGAVVLRQLSAPEISVTLTDRLTNQSFPPIFVRRLPAKPKKTKRDSFTITQNENPE